MRKTNFNWLLTLIAVIGFAYTSNADVCTQTFTASGYDDDPTTVTIVPSDLTCTGGGTINSITLVNTAGSFTNTNCGNWYDFTLIVDGTTIIANGCQADFDGTSIAVGFSTIEVHSNDLDAYSDAVTVEFDLQIDYTPATCPAPTGLTASAVTNNSATLSWVIGASETAWNVEYGTTGFAQGTGTTVAATDTFVNVTGLTAATIYDFYVQADCGGGDQSTWVGPFSFTTECGAYNVPWTEGFEGIASAGDFPLCVSSNGDFTTGTSSQSYNRDAHTGTNYLYTNYTADDWFFTVGINLTAGESYDFSYWYITDGNSGWTEVSSWVGTAQDAASMTDSLTGIANSTITSYEELRGTFVAPSTGVYYFGIHVIADGSPWYITFDDLSVDLTPSCPAPSGLSASAVTNNSATLSWVIGASETAWNVEYGTTGFAQGTGTGTTVAATDTFVDVTGLTAATTYDFYVQADCGGDQSTWVGPFSFTTACDAINVFPYTQDFDGAWDCWSVVNNDADTYEWSQSSQYLTPHSGSYVAHGMGNNDDYLISPQFDIVDGMEIRWWDIVENATKNNTYDVLLSTTTSDISSFTINLGTFDCTNTNWVEHVINLTGYTGNVYIAFHQTYSASAYYGFGIDDFVLQDGPTCPDPTNLDVQNITTTSADLAWTTGGASTWNVMFGIAGFDTTGLGPLATDITTNPLSVDTLSPATSYEFYVRDRCATDDSSAWVGPFSFTTECDAITTFPWLEDFEDNGTELPICFNNVEGTWNMGTESYSGNYAARISYSHPNPAHLESPNFILPANYQISFMWKDDDISTAKVAGADTTFFEVSTDDGTTWITLDTLSAASNESSYSMAEHDLSAYAGTFKFRFRDVNDGSFSAYGTGIDSIVIRERTVTDLALVTPPNGAVADCDFTGQDTVPCFIENVGNTVITTGDTIFAWYELDGGTAVADTFVLAADLNPTDTLFAMFAQTADLAGLTTHNYKVYFEYVNDMNPVNDTVIGTVTHYEPSVDLGGVNDTITVTAYPYTLDAGAGFDSYLWNDGSTNQTLDVSADGWYNVLAIDSNYCEATDTVYVVLPTGINTIENTSLSIYPNPNDGQFTLSAKFNTNVDFTVEMVNLNGKTIYTKEFNGVDAINETIDVDSYAKGIYYIRLVGNNFVKQEKVVVY